MAVLRERRASRLLVFRSGMWRWVLGAFLGLAGLLVLSQAGNPEAEPLSLPGLPSLQAIESPVSETLSVPTTSEAIPEPLRIRIEGLFSQIEAHPELKENFLRELKSVLHQQFAGQEDCWSCPGTEYFDRFDAVAGSAQSRKPLGLTEWLALGDEAYQNHKLQEARDYYSKARQVLDERVIQPEEEFNESAIARLNERCQQLNCR